jgi:hypothetical protein
MKIENILNNNEYKIFFLKAILLGIDYGNSNNYLFYKKNIENELNKLSLHHNSNNENINENLSSHQIPNNELSDQISKQQNIILNLDNQQKYLLSLINKLSINNYSYNYSK